MDSVEANPQPATYQDVLDAPPHKVAQVIDGVLHVHPRPAPRHARASSKIGAKLMAAFDEDDGGLEGGWWILDEPELHIGSHIIVPDIAGWRRERMPQFPETAYFTIPPDWVCEVLSPSTRQIDLIRKRRIYGEFGVSHLWFVDPEARTLEAFALVDGRWQLIAALSEADAVSVPPFDAISFALDALWV